MSRSLKIYQGEDQTPITDLTEPTSDVHVIWEEAEFGGRAYKGESSISTFPMRDEQGETGSGASLPSPHTAISVSAGNRLEVLVNGVRLFRGRVGPKDYSRGRQKADRARELTLSAQDTNFDLRRIIVDGWARPEETDVARVQALVTAYLTGNPRVTTNISTDYVATGSNTVTLPARVYDATNPAEILAELGSVANKLHFVTIDDELFYDGWDSNAYQAGLRISDRPDESTPESAVLPCGSQGAALVVDEAGADPVNYISEFPDWSGDQEERIEGNVSQAIPAGWTLIAFVSTFDDIVNLEDTTMYDEQGNTWTRDAQADRAGDGDERIEIWRCNVSDALNSGDWIRYAFNFGGSASGSIEGDGRCIKVWAVPATLSSPSVGTPASGFNSAPALASTPSGDITFVAINMHDPDGITGDADWTDIGTYTSIDAGSGNVAGLWAEYLEPGSGAGWNGTIDQNRDWVVQAVAYTSTEEGQDLPTFPPIWDVGPSSTEDGMELLSGLRLYYGQGSNTYVYVSDPTTANRYWHSEESLYTSDPAINSAARATTLANAILARRKYEDRTYNVSIGPLSEDQIGCLKPGQLINIKARAIPDADDAFVTRRIAQLRWTTPVPQMYFAHMMLDRPLKEAPYSVGPKTATDSINRHVEQGSNSHPEYVLRGTLIAQGDLPYRGASDWTRLAIGSSNTWLKSIGTQPVWATLPSSSGGIAVEEDGSEEGTGIDRLDFTTGLNVSVSGSQATISADSAATPSWTTYTPTWTATSVNPAIGNGTISGRYYISGKLLYLHISVTWGTTTTNGTGNYRFSYPASATSSVRHMLNAFHFDSSAGQYRFGQALSNFVSSSVIAVVVGAGTNTEWGNAQPVTHATGDQIIITGVMEID